MAKKLTLKSRGGVEISFAVNQVIVRGETVVKFPDGAEWSDGAAKQYAYGESYLAKIPDSVFAQIAAMLMPAPELDETADAEESTGDAQAETPSESAGAVE